MTRKRTASESFQSEFPSKQWGSGITRMSAACRDAGLPPPDLEEIGNRFRVTLYNEQQRGRKTSRHSPHGSQTQLDAMDQAILQALEQSEGLSTQEIATLIERTPRTARMRLTRLLQSGLVREIRSSPQDPQGRYIAAQWK